VERIDLAIVGGGAAGTYLASAVRKRRADWAVVLFERTDRIGGRLHSVRIPGLDHPIELGGMRFLTSQPRIASVVEAHGLSTHLFDETGGPDCAVLRGAVAEGATDPAAARNYELAPGERGRSAADLWAEAFGRIVPDFANLDHAAFARLRATGRYLDRPITDWPIGDVLESVLSPEGKRFVVDAFGYDSGIRAFNAPDLIEFLRGGGDPTTEARTPDAGMDRIPEALADSFLACGGSVRLGHELVALEVDGGEFVLRFANGSAVRAVRVVLTLPGPALSLLGSASDVLRTPSFTRVLGSVEGFPAMKLYLWYERPWWRPGIRGMRTVTDVPLRKVFYLDRDPDAPAALLAMYTDGLDVRPWAELHDGSAPGAAPSPAILEAIQGQLQAIHPDVGVLPSPIGSALMYWGADPHEVGWHFWRAGFVSDEILQLAPQPDSELPLFLAGEAFSRHQSWVEGALESADAVLERLS
jgi:monoamine oxidase